ncbi:hypothetical protein BDD43_2770 [Mucilaginibacter gracilis]|uniref:Uncharacterized protein n=1 Tax=Mucilaginibacter gracilis TaxID=423350 RepID=A0A495J0T1_9SPHI|nr:hypothetical protein [Mucilaginibacter gracilis]RKR82585.1 hypothetical protein BDD43_2770 [Mucilaginibacter gracilis]
MYWCKQKPIFAISFCLLFFVACRPDEQQTTPQYFGLEPYFKAEAERLNKLHPTINKSVIYNSHAETKLVAIKNWKQELGLFIESDINKPAWRNDYKVTVKADSVFYNAIDTNLRTRSIVIVNRAHKIKLIAITNFTKNSLYQTTDNLSYYPDSVYRIEKRQSVKILGANNYQITGRFK